mmetsp:Transcript_30988/g.51209  ORF Transcript_30988/g.51209 Transcript_30988/m.51209 type:complete len:295 (+) Transcript_30988:106-990(+)|eukprot:CAMPEP_0119008298 /NCGR_PEP_ID=MMETSP1176-20130426/3594_1 /TAXON_ID=265551 /ORGANISM="Synedropsis recta cf, Strain CCMP1620" /LENGTH=294 /DNA_ID=CAMNT_0006960605 /DNA_START=102 /DNA_END=986 /DNA_ORIENTATION=-
MTTVATKEMTPEDIEALSKKMGGGDKVKRKADDFPGPNSVPNAKLIPLFEDDDKNHIWTVRGSFSIIPYVFSLTSTMTIYRNESNNELTIFNAFRCEEPLEQDILKLGTIAHVVKLGQFHGDADAYYAKAPQFQKPKLWTLPEGSVAEGTTADEILSDTNLPVMGAKFFNLQGHPFPEGLMTVPCHTGGGPLLVACDSLVHIPDLSIVSYMGRFMFYLMGFTMQSALNVPKPAPLWCKQSTGAVGVECVRGWYHDIAAMEWASCVGAHGVPAKNCDHDAMKKTVEEQLAKPEGN